MERYVCPNSHGDVTPDDGYCPTCGDEVLVIDDHGSPLVRSGEAFTVPGQYARHPITDIELPYLQYFQATADIHAGQQEIATMIPYRPGVTAAGLRRR